MPITKASGDMYDKEWVQFCWSALVGHCEHECSYCFVPAIMSRFESNICNEPLHWASDVKVRDGKIIAPKLKEGRTFICHTIDLFAKNVPADWIAKILEHCWRSWCANNAISFVLQTKNPKRYMEFNHIFERFSNGVINFGITLETNRDISTISQAPIPYERMIAFREFINSTQYNSFITIEPIIKFDIDEFVSWFQSFTPDLIWVGADSKNSNLPEPSKEKTKELITELKKITEVRLKPNLKRIIGDDWFSGWEKVIKSIEL